MKLHTSQAESHGFNVALATQYGVEEAVLIAHFLHWINHNRRLKRNFKDGRTWTYQTRAEIAAWFPYWTEKQVRRITDNLVKKKVIRIGNYNKAPMDKTLWYAFENEKEFTIAQTGNSSAQMGNSSAQMGNSSAQMGKAIPESKTESKPDTKRNNVKTLPSSASDEKKHPKRFVFKLNPEQRKLHDQLVLIDGIESNDVCAWFLSNKWSVSQVATGLKIYKQDLRAVQAKGKTIDSAGGYICKAIQEKRVPRNEDYEFNKDFAMHVCRGVKEMQPKENYVTYRIQEATDQLMYSLPKATFMRGLENIKRKIQTMEYA